MKQSYWHGFRRQNKLYTQASVLLEDKPVIVNLKMNMNLIILITMKNHLIYNRPSFFRGIHVEKFCVIQGYLLYQSTEIHTKRSTLVVQKRFPHKKYLNKYISFEVENTFPFRHFSILCPLENRRSR